LKKLHIVLVGIDLAGIQCVKEIVKIHPNKFDISTFQVESDTSQLYIRSNLLNYIPLFEKADSLIIRREAVIKMDTDHQWVFTDKNQKYEYDRLIFATGSFPAMPLSGNVKTNSIMMTPNVQLAIKSGVPVNRGIIVNGFMETAIPNIFAVGECAEHRNQIDRLLEQSQEQGRVLAKRICGIICNPYQGSGSSSNFLEFSY